VKGFEGLAELGRIPEDLSPGQKLRGRVRRSRGGNPQGDIEIADIGERSMKTLLIAAVATTSLFTAVGASAQDSLMDYVLKSCETDIKQYCSQVTPGEGRLLHCAAAHEDKLSGQCSYALYKAASLLEQLSAAIVYVATECKADIEKFCSDVQAGEGRILSCLEANQAEVSDGCKQAVKDTVAD
jgi:hypothetical protein